MTDVLRLLEGQPGRVAATIRREAEASLAAIDGRRAEALAAFTDAARRWRELGLDFEAAVCGLSLVTMLGPAEPGARAAAEESGALFGRLGARPFQKLLAEAVEAGTSASGPRSAAQPVEDPRASGARAE